MPGRTPSRPPPSSASLPEGSLVWARMKGFSWWPSRIEAPKPEIRAPAAAKQKPHKFCFFFGAENFAWVEAERIVDYAENREKMKPGKISSNLQRAIDAIEEALVAKAAADAAAAAAAAEEDEVAAENEASDRDSESSASKPRMDADFDLGDDDDDDDDNFTLSILSDKGGAGGGAVKTFGAVRVRAVDDDEDADSVYFDCSKSPLDDDEKRRNGDDDDDAHGDDDAVAEATRKRRASPIQRSNSLSPLSMLHAEAEGEETTTTTTTTTTTDDDDNDEPLAKRSKSDNESSPDKPTTTDATVPRSETPTGFFMMQTPVRTFSRKPKGATTPTTPAVERPSGAGSTGRTDSTPADSLDGASSPKKFASTTPTASASKTQPSPTKPSDQLASTPSSKHQASPKKDAETPKSKEKTSAAASLASSPPASKNTPASVAASSPPKSSSKLLAKAEKISAANSSKKDSAKDSTKDSAKDSAKDSTKDSTKNSTKDLTKDSTKNSTKDSVKPGRKSLRESSKEDGKGSGRESAKDGKASSAKDASSKKDAPPKTPKSSRRSSPPKEATATTPKSSSKHSSKSSSKPSSSATTSSKTPSAKSSSSSLSKPSTAPSPLRFGFLGLGIMGASMASNLVSSGHDVMVWNRTASKCREVVKMGAERGASPADVVARCDITFSCVADAAALRDVVFGSSGALQGVSDGKGFVEMSTIDLETCVDVAEAIQTRGGKFLEAPICGSRAPARHGRLTILAAGDKELFDECRSCFSSLSSKTLYLGDVGNAGKMKTVLNLLDGVVMAGLAEAMALTEQVGLRHQDVLEVMETTNLDCELVREKGREMLDGVFTPSIALKHQQKDLKLAVRLADEHHLPLVAGAAANELFKRARAMGYDEHDNSAVYRAAQYNS